MSDWTILQQNDTSSVIWRRLGDGREESRLVSNADVVKMRQSGADIPPVTPQSVILDYTNAIQRHMDVVAQAWGYDNIYTAVTYADEPAVLEFSREGKALRAWRSRVWAAARQTLADVQGGNTPLPTVADLIASLPPAPVRG